MDTITWATKQGMTHLSVRTQGMRALSLMEVNMIIAMRKDKTTMIMVMIHITIHLCDRWARTCIIHECINFQDTEEVCRLECTHRMIPVLVLRDLEWDHHLGWDQMDQWVHGDLDYQWDQEDQWDHQE